MYIKAANPFSYNQNFVFLGYLPLPLDYIHVWNLIIFERLLWNSLTNFYQVTLWAFWWRYDINLFKWLCIIKMATMPIYGKKTPKNLLQNQESVKVESW